MGSMWGWMTGSDDATRALKNGTATAQGFADRSLANANAAWLPYASAGSQGMASLSSLMQGGGNVSGRLDSADYMTGVQDPGAFAGVGDLTQDAGYQARMNAAQNALNENQFLDGTYGSGAAAKEMAGYMQEKAGNEYDKAYDRAMSTWEANSNKANQDRNFGYQRYLSDLGTLTGDVERRQGLASTMLGAGQNAAGAQSGNWMNWGTQGGNNAMGAANASAQNAMASSPWAALSGLANLGANTAIAYKGF